MDVFPIVPLDGNKEYGFRRHKNDRLPEHLNQKIRDLIIDEMLEMEDSLSDGYRFYCSESVHAFLGKKADTIVTIINNYIENA